MVLGERVLQQIYLKPQRYGWWQPVLGLRMASIILIVTMSFLGWVELFMSLSFLDRYMEVGIASPLRKCVKLGVIIV